MRFPSSLILLSSLSAITPSASAADQIPLREKVEGWLDQVKAYIPTAIPTPAIPNPIAAGAAKVAEQVVEKIGSSNYQQKLGPKLEGEEEWMIYLTGQNKSCWGRCGKADLAWNQSVPLLAALPRHGASTLKLGTIDCDADAPLCTGWAAAVPAVWHFVFPQKSSDPSVPIPLSPLHEVRLNVSTVQSSEIVAIPRASKATYLNVEEYTGVMHPIDGPLAKFGLLMPWGYLLWGFGTTPSWLIMIGISFFSRQWMSKKLVHQPGVDGRVPGAGAGAGAGVRAGGAKKK